MATAADSLELLAGWRKFLSVSVSPRTEQGYWGWALRFLSYTPKPIYEVTEEDIIAWLAHYPPRSSARTGGFYALRSLFRWAKRRGHILFDPTEGVSAPSPRERAPVALSEEEVRRLTLAAAHHSPIRGLAICLFYFTGCRLHEATHLRWGDISDRNLIVKEAKGGKERAVPIGDGLAATLNGLQDHRNGDDRILPRAPATVWLWVREAGRIAELGPRAHPHLIRATFATRLLSQGAKIHTVRDLLGHANLKTTVRYLAVTDEDRRDAVALL